VTLHILPSSLRHRNNTKFNSKQYEKYQYYILISPKHI